jgi:hypothetical protein
MRGRGDLVLLALALLVFIALALARPQSGEQPSVYSSYDTGRNGYRAIYEVMRRERVATSRYEAELGLLRAFAGTIVLSANNGSYVSVDRSDAQLLAQLARDGARIIVMGVPDDALTRALGTPSTQQIDAASSALAVAGVFTRSVHRVAGSFSTVFKRKRGARTLLLAARRPAAIAYQLGRGTVIAIAAPDVPSNVELALDQNARFAYDILSGPSPVLFDERLHGYAEGTSMWAVLPASVHDAVWIALGVVLLAVVGGAFRSAPPIALEPVRERDSSAYLAAMASLLRRAHAGASAIERFNDDAQRLARQRRSLATRPDVAAGLHALDEMQFASRFNDAAVLAAARTYAWLRKEFGR